MVEQQQEAFLTWRHLKIRPGQRRDYYLVDGMAHRPPDDGVFFVAFLFEDRDGTPLAVYY